MVVVCLSSLSFTSVAVVAIGVTALRLGDGGGLSALSLLHLFGDVGDGNGLLSLMMVAVARLPSASLAFVVTLFVVAVVMALSLLFAFLVTLVAVVLVISLPLSLTVVEVGSSPFVAAAVSRPTRSLMIVVVVCAAFGALRCVWALTFLSAPGWELEGRRATATVIKERREEAATAVAKKRGRVVHRYRHQRHQTDERERGQIDHHHQQGEGRLRRSPPPPPM